MKIKFNENIPQSTRGFIEVILQNQKFEHHVIKAELSALGVRGEMKANIKSKEDVKVWLDTFEKSTNTTYRVNYTKPSVGVWILYKLGVKCHHNTGGKKLKSDKNRSCKNTKCPSRITFTVNTIPKKVFKRNCYVDPELPTVIDFYYEHNHPINSADVLRFRPVDSSVEDKLITLYQKGHSPASALQVLKIDIETEHPNDFETYLSDRKYCPDLSYCHRLFYKKFKNKYNSVNFQESREFISQRVHEYNELCKMTCVKCTESTDDFILAICTPLMFRVHQNVPQAADIMFVDATGYVKEKDKVNKKELGHRMFLLSTYNSTGCLPLGVIITFSDSPNIIYKGLELYKSLLPLGGNYFYGRGEMGPSVILTDDSISERVALNMSFGLSKILLCTFHVLQTMWRWLMKSKNCIKKDDRSILFEIFKSIVYASTEQKCQEYYEKLNSLAKDYNLYLNHLSSLWERRSEWALCYRTSTTTVIRENIINQNVLENVVKVLKDEIFERVKSFNLTQLIDFIFTRFESYYCRKLLDVAYERDAQKKTNDKKPFWKSPSDTILKSIRELDNSGVYNVPSESDPGTMHTVDVQLVCCTCSVGRNGIMCKHQYWVSLYIDKCRAQKILEFRKRSYYLATGEEANDMRMIANSGSTSSSSQQIINDDNNITPTVTEMNSQAELWNDGFKIIQEKLKFNNNDIDYLLKNFIDNLKKLPNNTEDIFQLFQNFGNTNEKQVENEHIIQIERVRTEQVDEFDDNEKQKRQKLDIDNVISHVTKSTEISNLENSTSVKSKGIIIISNDPVNITTAFQNYYDSNSIENDSKTIYNISTEP